MTVLLIILLLLIETIKQFKKKEKPTMRDFLGGSIAETPHFQCREPGFNPWSGN